MGKSMSGPFMPEGLAAALNPAVSGTGFYFPGVYTPRRASSQSLVLRFPHFPHFLQAPTQNPKVLEKSTNSCNP